MKGLRNLGAMILVMVMTGMVHASVEINIVAEAIPTRVKVGDSFTYTVEVSGNKMKLPNPDVDIPSEFDIYSGPSTSINTSWVNGQMSASRTLTYQLLARKAGVFTIDPPTLTYKKRRYSGNKVVIVVSSSSRKQQRTQGHSSNRSAVPNPSSPITSDEPLFLQVDVDPAEVYVQQPLTVTYTLYFRHDVRSFDVKRLSSTEGFWTEEWPVPNPPTVLDRTINGKSYRAAAIYRTILFPTRDGELTIGPMEVVCEVRQSRRRRSRSLFDDFFDNPFDVEQKLVASEPYTVTVLPLPAEGKPKEFDEVVGKYRLRAELDRDTVETNESVTLHINISGEGNIGFLPEPKLVVPPDIQKYDPEVKEKHQSVGGKVRGTKTFSYLLIPRKTGKQRIKSITYSYFDPEKKRYYTLRSKPLELVVKPATGWAALDSDSPLGSRTEVKSLGQDIRFIHDSTRGLRKIGPPLQERLEYQLAYLFPLIIALGSLFVSRKREKMESDPARKRSRQALKRAHAALKGARKDLTEKKIDEGFDALATGLVTYLADRINVPAAELGIDRFEEILGWYSIDRKSLDEVRLILDTCNSARFAPGGASEESLSSLIERTESWIRQVDRFLEKKRPNRNASKRAGK